MADAATALRDGFLRLHPDDAADVLESLPAADVAEVIASAAPSVAAEVLDGIGPETASGVLSALRDDAFVAVVAELDPTRTAILLARLDDPQRDRLLRLLDSGAAGELLGLLSYPPSTAGHVMDPRPTTFRTQTTAEEALGRLRERRPNDFEDVFIVDADGRLIGTVALEDLALAAPGRLLDDLVRASPAAVQATASVDEAVALADELEGAVPVIDVHGRLLGVVGTRELVSAAEEQASADLQTMVGVSAEERALSPASFAVRRRLPWLLVNLATAFLAAGVVGAFESTIARVSALAVLMPVVAGQSGNGGAQALAVTMRGLALREVRGSHWRRLAFKEASVGLANGLAVSLVTMLGVLVWSRSPGLALVIGVSMVISMAVAGFAGASVPMVLKAFGQDPAQSSSIVLTTVTDVTGFLTFLGLASIFASQL